MQSAHEPIRLAIEIDPDAQPLSGRIERGGRAGREFVGWSGLAAALTILLEEPEPSPEPPAPRPSG
jgi:hypothetical protein